MPLLQALAALCGAAAAVVGLVLGAGAVSSLVIALRVGSQFPPAGPFIEIPGGRLATIEAGPRESARATVVLLHGASANAADPMEAVGHTLAAQGFRVIAFDRPGLGWSDRIEGASAGSPKVQGDLIAAALARMGVGPAILLGHSWGGALALSIALDHPERVSGLVLVAPVARPFAQREAFSWYWRIALEPSVAWLLSHTVGPPAGLYFLSGAAQSAFAPQPVSKDYLERSRAALGLRPGAVLANIQDLVALPGALALQAPRYGALRVPTLIVAGDADPLVPTRLQGAPLAGDIPGARLVTLPGIGHMVPWVASDALATEVSRLADGLRLSPKPAPEPEPAAAP